jgi:hypothetical protein
MKIDIPKIDNGQSKNGSGTSPFKIFTMLRVNI